MPESVVMTMKLTADDAAMTSNIDTKTIREVLKMEIARGKPAT